MGGIAQAVIIYAEKWEYGAALDNDPKLFIEETKTIFKALINRVERENKDLYAIADDL